jgi:hypothetical protein
MTTSKKPRSRSCRHDKQRTFKIRLSELEHANWTRAASYDGRALSAWIRAILNDHAEARIECYTAEFRAACARMQTRIAERLKREPVVRYDMYITDAASELPVDNLDDVAVVGRVQFYLPYDAFFADLSFRPRPGARRAGQPELIHGTAPEGVVRNPEPTDFRSGVVENPTWLDVAAIADEAIRHVQDYHHVFLEDTKLHVAAVYTEDVPVYTFCLGS